MKLYNFSFLFFTFFISINSFSQDTIQTPIVVEIKPINTIIAIPTPTVVLAKTSIKIPSQIFSHWTSKNKVGFDLSEIKTISTSLYFPRGWG